MVSRQGDEVLVGLGGLGSGIVLQSVFDDAITCTVRDERRVEFRGEEQSLSSSALQIANEKGLGWSAVAGPDYWKFEGKTLSEPREEKASRTEDRGYQLEKITVSIKASPRDNTACDDDRSNS
jgi:hypothetical protein